jgi:predicted phosphodiesterase
MRFALTSDLHRGYSTRTSRIHQKFFDTLSRESFDVLLLAGDLGTARIEHFQGLLRAVREALPDHVILAVRGNHDLWDRRKRYYFLGGAYRNLSQLLAYQEHLFEKYRIQHLESQSFVRDGVFVTGWDGWYSDLNPPTNDELHLPSSVEGIPVHAWLNRRAHTMFDRVLQELDAHPTYRRIVVTHMPCFAHETTESLCANPRYIDFLQGRCEVLCVGHEHRHRNMLLGGIQIYESGSGYDHPRYMIFEI